MDVGFPSSLAIDGFLRAYAEAGIEPEGSSIYELEPIMAENHFDLADQIATKIIEGYKIGWIASIDGKPNEWLPVDHASLAETIRQVIKKSGRHG